MSHARRTRQGKDDWEGLTANEQAAVLATTQQDIMDRRTARGIDANSRLTAAINDESVAIAAINAEELEEKLKALPKGEGKA
ncbi:hypothetical protein GMDG_08723, partial [Pseudogymnoascus destructans 20631-21]